MRKETQSDQIQICLDTIYCAIYRLRLLIEIHKKIANYSTMLTSQDMWGFIQNNLLFSEIIVELFSIFDKRKDSVIKKISQLAKAHGSGYLSIMDIESWKNTIDKYEDYRHKMFAHKEAGYQILGEVDYNDIIKIIDELDEKLLNIEKNILQKNNIAQKQKITSMLNLNLPVLLEFERTLRNDCEPKTDKSISSISINDWPT